MKVKKVARKALNVENIDEYKSFSDIPNIDSVELIEFVFQLEKELNIEIPDENISKITDFSSAIMRTGGWQHGW